METKEPRQFIAESEKYKKYYNMDSNTRTRQFEDITKLWVINAKHWQEDHIIVASPHLKRGVSDNGNGLLRSFKLPKEKVMECLEADRNLIFMKDMKETEYSY